MLRRPTLATFFVSALRRVQQWFIENRGIMFIISTIMYIMSSTKTHEKIEKSKSSNGKLAARPHKKVRKNVSWKDRQSNGSLTEEKRQTSGESSQEWVRGCCCFFFTAWITLACALPSVGLVLVLCFKWWIGIPCCCDFLGGRGICSKEGSWLMEEAA